MKLAQAKPGRPPNFIRKLMNSKLNIADAQLYLVQMQQLALNNSHCVKNQSHKRKNFTPEEDQKLRMLVNNFGSKNWKKIAQYLPGRTDRQCRERFRAYLDPKVNCGPWTEEEDQILIEKQAQLGTKWSLISTFLPGRSDNNVKNRWYKHLRVKTESSQDASENSPHENLTQVLDSWVFGFDDIYGINMFNDDDESQIDILLAQ